jgi:hypothetical protein
VHGGVHGGVGIAIGGMGIGTFHGGPGGGPMWTLVAPAPRYRARKASPRPRRMRRLWLRSADGGIDETTLYARPKSFA